jgi:hypothetical protein
MVTGVPLNMDSMLNEAKIGIIILYFSEMWSQR